MFSLWSPSRSLNKSAGNQLQNGANKKAKELSLSLFASIINPANKDGYGVRGARGWPLSLHCALSLQDSLYRWCTPTLQGCYLSPGQHQAYETHYLYFKSTPSLQSLPRLPKSCGSPDRLVAHNNRIARSLSARVKRVQGYY